MQRTWMPEYGCASPEPRANPVLKRSVYTVDGAPCAHSTLQLESTIWLLCQR